MKNSSHCSACFRFAHSGATLMVAAMLACSARPAIDERTDDDEAARGGGGTVQGGSGGGADGGSGGGNAGGEAGGEAGQPRVGGTIGQSTVAGQGGQVLALDAGAKADAFVTVPSTVSPADQLAAVRKLAASVCRSVVTFDSEDNVIAINLSNHSVFCGGAKPTGVTDEQAAELLNLPELKRVRFESMPMTPRGYQVLAKLRNLEAALFAYPTSNPDFMLSVKDQANLKVLELKHLFSVVGSRLDQLPVYPELRILELDVTSANRVYALPFIKKQPKLLSLQLHRTNLTNDDVSEIVDAVPDLEGLELKPSGTMNDGVFIHVGRLKKLRVLQLTGLSVPAWEAGGKYLAGLPQLKVIVGSVAGDTAAQLRMLIPGIGIGGSSTAEQRSLTDKDNPYFLKAVTPWMQNGRKQEYRFDRLQATVGSEDIG